MSKSKAPMTPSKLKVGDRVTENIKNVTCVSPFADKKVKDTVAGYIHNTRVGTVKEVFVKTNKRGDRRHYATVLWDHLKTPTEHEQGRLKVHMEVSKPSEPKKSKQTTSVEIWNLGLVTDKEIFTAKTEDGYIGCVRMASGICLTATVHDSALEAANKARSLKRMLTAPSTQDCEETRKKTEVAKKCVVTKTKKKVTLRSRLYTLDETLAMPLLRFREVWIITKDLMYVSDCLDKERKNLVSYTTDQEKALYFTCHEKAKMTMRVLKSTVGPGFDLKRFFIENR